MTTKWALPLPTIESVSFELSRTIDLFDTTMTMMKTHGQLARGAVKFDQVHHDSTNMRTGNASCVESLTLSKWHDRPNLLSLTAQQAIIACMTCNLDCRTGSRVERHLH